MNRYYFISLIIIDLFKFIACSAIFDKKKVFSRNVTLLFCYQYIVLLIEASVSIVSFFNQETMGAVKSLFKLFLVGGIISAGLVFYFCPDMCKEHLPPNVPDEYYGRGLAGKKLDQLPKDNPAINKYAIKVEDGVLQDLKLRLEKTRFVEPLEGSKFNYGFNGDHLKQVVDYWKTKFDWRKQEQELNKFSQFTTQIEGIKIHFIHQKPNVPKNKIIRVIPLLLLHGWPGSIAEFTKIIPILTTPRQDKDYVFEVISPSIPGYGFSEAPHQKGFNFVSAARIFSKLMARLGFKQYYVQGGDWGSAIALATAKIYPNEVSGVHVTMVPTKAGICEYVKLGLGYFVPSLFMTPEEHASLYPFSDYVYFLLEESGYFHIQATKPDTVGAGLADSPAGLAAYILEKFSTGTDKAYRDSNDGGLTKKFTMDELLTNVMIYWINNNMASAMRFYKEYTREDCRKYNMEKVPVKVPSGIASFPHDVKIFPKSFLTREFHNLVRYERMTQGGHFSALEEPKLLADEVFSFVGDVEQHVKQATAAKK